MIAGIAFKAAWASMTSFLSAIPLKVYIALSALLIALVTLWVIWGHYKDLTAELAATKDKIVTEQLLRETAEATIEVMKVREAEAIANLNELEAQKSAIEVEWQNLQAQLDEIQGDLDAAADLEHPTEFDTLIPEDPTFPVIGPDDKPPPGQFLVDQLNHLNGTVNRMLRQGEGTQVHGDSPGAADNPPGKAP